MKITVLPVNRLSSQHLLAWDRWQRADKALDSPFFRPDFTQAVAAIRPGVAVAVLEEDGQLAGFFPFQRGRWGTGKPVGGRLSDFQGLVTRPGLSWSADELIRGCGLNVWDFDHLVAAQQPFQPYYFRTEDCAYIDLSNGFEGYQAERRLAGSTVVRRTLRSAFKLEREVGPIRFLPRITDPSVLAALVAWKSDQYRRTRATNVFAFPWARQLLEHVLGCSGEPFAGVLSALYAGDHLVAVHLGLYSYGVIHWWFPAYNRSFGEYSPGLVMLMELAKFARSLAIQRIDLGKVNLHYKTRCMSGTIRVAEGSVAVHPLVRAMRRGWHRTRAWLQTSPLGAPVRLAGGLTRPIRGWLALR
jgi:CelD/BcsL family acetyltransferase involved in cellulose biosynthesis